MSAVKAASCKPSEIFWLEIAGTSCLDGHSYVLTEPTEDGSITIPLETTSEYKGRRGPIQAGEICTSAERSLYLVLEGEKQILAPLIENDLLGPEAIKPPQREYQNNLMVPIHPTLFCDSGELMYERPLHHYDACLEAPMRTGWLYVFFRGKLWRELAVRSAEDSAPIMQDVAVAATREASGMNKNDRRPVGPEIDTLHIPAYLLGAAVYDEVQIAFSESQWAWQHILDLEAYEDLRNQRCQKASDIRKILRFDASGGLFTGWSFIDHLVPMRGRDHPIESDMLFPYRWLSDVDGSRTQSTLDELESQRDAIESDAYTVDQDMYISESDVLPRWRMQHHKGGALPEIEAGQDVFESLRGRHIGSLTLKDSLFAARHLGNQMNEALVLLLGLVEDVKKRKHGTTADLFHKHFRNTVLPDGSPNPLYTEDRGWLDDRLDESEEGLLLRTLYSVERKALRDLLLRAQSAIVRMFDNQESANLTAVLRDLFNMEPGSDIAGYVQVGPLLQLLNLPVGQIDPIMLPQEFVQSLGDGTAELNDRLLAGSHPLAGMMLPLKLHDDLLPGDATVVKLQATIDALEDRSREMRTVEANALRSIADHLKETSDATVSEMLSDYRFGAHAAYGPLSAVGGWWLQEVTNKLASDGQVVRKQLGEIGPGFEKFAGAAIGGRTTLELVEGDSGTAHIALRVVDKNGKPLTSAAKASDFLELASKQSFGEVAKSLPYHKWSQATGKWMHAGVTSPYGIPPLLVMFDIYNLVNAFNTETNDARYFAGIASASLDLIASTGQWISLMPKQSAFVAAQVGTWKVEAGWFSKMANHVNSGEDLAETVTRNKLGAFGWTAGMLTTSLFVWDAVGNLFKGRANMAAADFTKAIGTGLIANADIVAGRLLTPTGRMLVERPVVQAVNRTLAAQIGRTIVWGGTVTSAWVTLLGFAVFFAGESLYYSYKDDAISGWLRGGPFSGDEDERIPEWQHETEAYLALMKTMTTVGLERIEGSHMQAFLSENDLSIWKDHAESVLLFNTPAFAIATQAPDIKLNLTYERRHYEILGPNPASGGWRTQNLEEREGNLAQIVGVFVEPQTIAFVVTKEQLPAMVPENSYQRVETRYSVSAIEMTYAVEVWQPDREAFETREISQKLTDVDIANHA